eukprot:Nitzschia sp. Nitz4//scaffold231_size31564//17049//17849//NITZ4_007941-RA/size31564-processed-gene-0.37-mRNA-1//-1//CDS//3329543296//2002//frame0
MAVSIFAPMSNDGVFGKGRSQEEESIQIFLPPKPKGMNPGPTSSSGDEAVTMGSVMTLSSLSQEEDLAASKLPFVWKLYEMLEEVERNGQEDIVSWVDEGKAFKVHKLDSFVQDIIPKYFRQSKYKSFQRQLYFYEFARIQSGPNAGGYCHPKFIKGVKTLCLSMTPKKSQRVSKKGSRAKKEAEAMQPPRRSQESDPSEWMTQIENLMTYGAQPTNGGLRQQRSNSWEQTNPTSLERSGPSDGDTVFVFGGKPFHFVEAEFSDLP